MAKFKVGDKVVCVNPGHNTDIKLGEEYTVKYCGEQEQGSTYPAQVGIDLAQAEYSVDRFELVKEPISNGVDAEGKPSYFSQDMLKPFMRVEQKSNIGNCYSTYIFTGEFLVSTDGWNNNDDFERIGAVYAPPMNAHYLNPTAKGNLIWKRQAPKTSEQLEQEAALAARNKAIEEAEKALKMAQDKLNELKGL